MQVVNQYADTTLGYGIGVYAMLSAHDVASYLGIALVLAKLIQEVPKVLRVFRGKNAKGD